MPNVNNIEKLTFLHNFVMKAPQGALTLLIARKGSDYKDGKSQLDSGQWKQAFKYFKANIGLQSRTWDICARHWIARLI